MCYRSQRWWQITAISRHVDHQVLTPCCILWSIRRPTTSTRTRTSLVPLHVTIQYIRWDVTTHCTAMQSQKAVTAYQKAVTAFWLCTVCKAMQNQTTVTACLKMKYPLPFSFARKLSRLQIDIQGRHPQQITCILFIICQGWWCQRRWYCNCLQMYIMYEIMTRFRQTI